MRKLSLFFIALIVLLSSCGEDNAVSIAKGKVFITGYRYDTTTFKDTPTVWSGEESNALSQNEGNAFSKAITLQGNNYFATGYENTQNGWLGRVWKNGEIAYSLAEDGATVGYGIATDGNDIYVAGHYYQSSLSKHFAVLWKNGEMIKLTDGSNQAEAFSVAVSGGDVYVGGYDGAQGRLWKNGVAQDLASNANFHITDIAISNENVYAVGLCNCSSPFIRYWKNGAQTTLTDGSKEAYGYGIAVSGSDVYIVGSERLEDKRIARIWKNGNPTNLTLGLSNAIAYDVSVFESDVYVVGYERSANEIFDYAMLWKNNIPEKLGERRAVANSIAIKQ